MLFLVAVLAEAMLVVRLAKLLSIPVGQCRECGYSLRGLRSSRCPECGTVFTEKDEGRSEGGGEL